MVEGRRDNKQQQQQCQGSVLSKAAVRQFVCDCYSDSIHLRVLQANRKDDTEKCTATPPM